MALQDQRVLITGADGFIGSHLTEHLFSLGARVTALAQYNSFNYWGWLEDLPFLDQIQVVTGDIRDAAFCQELTRDIDIVFHLAALIPIPYSYRAPESYVDTNIKGTLNMMQASRANRVRRFIHTSTSEVYGSARYVPIDENHPLQAQSPYSATKIGADALAYSFHSAFDFPVFIARPFNTYGPRQSARAIIPTVIAQAAAGQSEIRVGDLHPTRDLTFVGDTVRGFAALAGLDHGFGEVFHIGSNFEISVGDLIREIGEVMGRKLEPITETQRQRPPKSEVVRLWCENRKLLEASGFRPEVSLREGLRRTAEWFCQPGNLQKYKPGIYNV